MQFLATNIKHHRKLSSFIPFSRQLFSDHKIRQTNPVPTLGPAESIDRLNMIMKQNYKDKKAGKAYIEKMPQERVDKIGSQSLLDKQWSDKPLQIIKNPHKLTEVDLIKTLEKICIMPEKRLKAMLKMGGNAVNEVFLDNMIKRFPLFLTTTLVNITKTLLIQKDYFKNHVIWRHLEQELHRKRNNLNNEQLATVVHAFGITGNGSKQFYSDLEEVIIDTPIPIETDNLVKILSGYSEIDQGSAVFYSNIAERIMHRGLEYLEPTQLAVISRHLSKATNVHKAGFGFYHEMEKQVLKSLHEGKVNFQQLSEIVEHILPANIGSNQFHLELEKFLVQLFTTENLQDFTNLVKGLQLYQIKTEALKYLIYRTVEKFIDDFTIKQLETLIWSLSKNVSNEFKGKVVFEELPPQVQSSLKALIEKVRVKSPSMKPRGVAFAVESIATLQYKDESVFKNLEKVIFSKVYEFISHYLVKMMCSYIQVGYGSGELYDKLINQIIQLIKDDDMKYSDMLRFFEVFPEVTYIYDNTMNEELYTEFIKKIQKVIKDKKFPTEDACRVFNILVRISPYQSSELMTNTENRQFMYELIGRLRHAVYDIPKEYFTLSMANFIEFQQPELASKFIFIIEEVAKKKQLTSEFDQKELIQMYWSLFQLEKAFKNDILITQENLQFLNDVDLSKLSARDFNFFKQLVCLVQMYNLSDDAKTKDDLVDYAKIYEKISNLSQDKREEFINEDPATKSKVGTTQEIAKYIKKQQIFTEISQNLSDDVMNLINVACVKAKSESEPPELFGVMVYNRHCYLQGVSEDELVVKKSVELKVDALQQLFGWNLVIIDEDDYIKQTDKEKYLSERLQLEKLGVGTVTPVVEKAETIKEDQKQEEYKGGRKARRRTCGDANCNINH